MCELVKCTYTDYFIFVIPQSCDPLWSNCDIFLNRTVLGLPWSVTTSSSKRPLHPGISPRILYRYSADQWHSEVFTAADSGTMMVMRRTQLFSGGYRIYVKVFTLNAYRDFTTTEMLRKIGEVLKLIVRGPRT